MNEQKTRMPEPLAQDFERLSEDVVWLHARWTLYKQLFAVSQERVNLLNRTADELFYTIQQVLWDDLILTMCKLFDRPQDGGKKNLVLAGLMSHLNSDKYKSLKEKLQSLMDSFMDDKEKKLEPFRHQRNKRIAHRDYPTAFSSTAFPITVEMVESVLADIRNCLNMVQDHFDGHTTAYEHYYNRRVVDGLFIALKNTMAYEDELKRSKGKI